VTAASNPVWPSIDAQDSRLYADEAELNAGEAAHIERFFADLFSGPGADAGLNAQLLYGDRVTVLEQRADKARVKNHRDGYVGWVDGSTLSAGAFHPTHRVTAPRTFLYPGQDMKLPRSGYRSMGSLVEVVGYEESRGISYAMLSDGAAVVSRHLRPIDDDADDFVTVAESLLATPYLWGGNTAFGLDCSGLVQLSMLMTGSEVLRDSDMQAATIGEPLKIGDDWSLLERGDLIFWHGHVAIAQGHVGGDPHMIHANAHTMDVTSEPVEQAVSRIAHLYELPIGVRRP